MKSKFVSVAIVLILALVFAALWLPSHKTSPARPPAGLTLAETKLVTVRFANLPYGDHTIASIGVAKGFFREAGIDLVMETIKVEEIVPALAGGKFDVVSVPPGILFSSHDTAPNLISFVFSDLFQGYALMSQPDKGFKRYTDFIKQGKSHAEALAATIQQVKGQTFAYPSETAIKPFIDKLLHDGKIGQAEFKALVLDDPLTVSAMRKGEADFQVGGVPSRLQLEKEGFIPLLTSSDLAKGAKPSADSAELAAVLQNGWATTKEYYAKNPETILRLASVNYRIMQFMREHESEALAIHMKYLAQVTGQEFTQRDGEIIYHSLDPFFTFAEQKAWFHDQASPFYYAYVNGAILNSFLEKKVFTSRPPTVEDVIFADDTFLRLESLKTEAETELRALESKQGTTPEVAKAIEKVRQFMAAGNYLDASYAAKRAGNPGN